MLLSTPPQDPLLANVASLLAGVEHRVITHINGRLQEQQEWQQAMRSELHAIVLAQQAMLVNTQLAQEASADFQAKKLDVERKAQQASALEQEKRIIACINACCNGNGGRAEGALKAQTSIPGGRQSDRSLSLPQGASGNSLSSPLLAKETISASPTSATKEGRKQSAGNIPLNPALWKRGAEARMASLFPHVEDLMESISLSLKEHAYDVEDCYNEEGIWQKIARHSYFKGVMLLVVVMNIFWIAVEVDLNKANVASDSPLFYQVVDNLFCFIFAVELFIRFNSFAQKIDAWRDPWFVFDASLVSLMVGETWIMALCNAHASLGGLMRNSQVFRTLRLVRLARVARATRILQMIPELLILAQGMFAAMRGVLAVVCMLMLIIYVFGVTFTMTLSGSKAGSGNFETVPQSINYLLLQVLCGPDSEVMMSLLDEEWGIVYYLMYLSFLAIALLTLMNMLIGIMCDVCSDAAASAKEEAFAKEVEHQLSRMSTQIDADHSGTIDRAEFDLIIKDPQLAHSFTELNVDLVGIAQFGEFIYEITEELSYAEFAVLVGQFRGSKSATVKDLMDIRRYMSMELLSFENRQHGPMDSSP